MSYIPWSVCLSLLGISVGANVKCVFLLNSQAWGETANRRCDKKLHRLLCYATRTHYFSSDTCCGSLPQRSGFFLHLCDLLRRCTLLLSICQCLRHSGVSFQMLGPLSPVYVAVTQLKWTEHRHTHTRLTDLCSGLPVWAGFYWSNRDSEWQWHQLGHVRVCTSVQTDNHASTPPLSFFTGRMLYLPPNRQRQSTEGRVKYSELTGKLQF